MGQKITITSKEVLELSEEPFASGYEGEVYTIKSPTNYHKHCIKLYKVCLSSDDRDSKKLEKINNRKRKIEYMINNMPPKLSDRTWMICWPIDIVYLPSGQFGGFLMPLAFEKSIELYTLTLPNLAPKNSRIWKNNDRSDWLRYERTNTNSIRRRFQLNANIALAIRAIHSVKNYVIVDLKPLNILVSPSGQVSIIDTDSIQISENFKVLFHSQMVTADYLPPESDPNVKKYIDISYDNFILSIIFYEVLFGLKPFEGSSYNPPYGNCNTVRERIKCGLFPFGKKKEYFSFLAPQHLLFKQCPIQIQKLFMKALDDGIESPEFRPSAEDWGRAFYEEVKKMKVAIIEEKPIQKYVVPKMSPDHVNSQRSRITNVIQFASFIQRFFAFVLDSIVYFILMKCLEYLVRENYFGDRGADSVTISILTNIGLLITCFIIPESSTWQGTIGKRVFGIKVTGMDGDKITFLKSAFRFLCKGLFGMLFFVGWLFPLWTSKKQALHDLIVRTLVVKDSN